MLDLALINKVLSLVGSRRFSALNDPAIASIKLHGKVNKVWDLKESGFRSREIRLKDDSLPVGVPLALSDFLLHFVYATSSLGLDILEIKEGDLKNMPHFKSLDVSISLLDFLSILHFYVTELFVLNYSIHSPKKKDKLGGVIGPDRLAGGLSESDPSKSLMPTYVFLLVQLFCRSKRIPLDDGMSLMIDHYLKESGITRDGV